MKQKENIIKKSISKEKNNKLMAKKSEKRKCLKNEFEIKK